MIDDSKWIKKVYIKVTKNNGYKNAFTCLSWDDYSHKYIESLNGIIKPIIFFGVTPKSAILVNASKRAWVALESVILINAIIRVWTQTFRLR